ncbi:hypothetical protein [Roseibium album]
MTASISLIDEGLKLTLEIAVATLSAKERLEKASDSEHRSRGPDDSD